MSPRLRTPQDIAIANVLADFFLTAMELRDRILNGGGK